MASSDLIGNNQRLLEHYLLPFTLTFVVVSLSFALILFLVGRVLSGRIAGPVYAFEKFLDDLLSGRPRALRLRAGDEFKHLEKLAARLVQLAAEGHMGAKFVVNGVANGIATGIPSAVDPVLKTTLTAEPNPAADAGETSSVATVTELTQPIEALSASVILSKK